MASLRFIAILAVTLTALPSAPLQAASPRDAPRATPPVSPRQARFAEATRLYKAKDFAGAAQIFAELATQGYAPAQLQLGYQYLVGEGVGKDSTKALEWYRKAAEQGNAVAQTNLGLLYETGNGVAEDWVTAASWYQRSANQSYARGQYSLGRAYQFGIGVPQSRADAIKWLTLAANQGYEKVVDMVNELLVSGTSIGFRTPEEQRLVKPEALGTGTPPQYTEPRGKTFRNSAERDRYLRSLSKPP